MRPITHEGDPGAHASPGAHAGGGGVSHVGSATKTQTLDEPPVVGWQQGRLPLEPSQLAQSAWLVHVGGQTLDDDELEDDELEDDELEDDELEEELEADELDEELVVAAPPWPRGVSTLLPQASARSAREAGR